MHSIGLLSALALVGSTLAAPVPDPKLVVVTEWEAVTVTAGVGAGIGAKPTSYSTVVVPSKPTSTVKVSATAKPTTTAKPSSTTVKTPEPTQAKTTAAAAAASSSSSYIDIVNKWRGNMKLSTLKQDSTLQSNALKTATDGNGKMVHQLLPGTFGQVLAPGTADNFEKVFVGGWLCEVSSTPGLNGICTTMSKGWNYAGQTGHNKILTDTKYTKIGCALAKGIWACDLGY